MGGRDGWLIDEDGKRWGWNWMIKVGCGCNDCGMTGIKFGSRVRSCGPGLKPCWRRRADGGVLGIFGRWQMSSTHGSVSLCRVVLFEYKDFRRLALLSLGIGEVMSSLDEMTDVAADCD